MSLAQPDNARGTTITISAVSMTFDRNGKPIEALKDVSFEVGGGQFCSILGPSGCGKSTLMMLVAGLTRPSSGSILLNGSRLESCYTDVGIVFQSDVLLPWLSVLDNVMLPAKVKRLPRAASLERAKQLIARVGLEGFEEHFPDELSGGMRQRTAICRALLHEPSVLLMDEPFGALDALTRERMQIDLSNLWTSDLKTILFITHDIEEAIFLSDQVVVMSQRPGRILQIFDIPFPQPRAPDIRQEQEFQAIVSEIRHLFRDSGIL